MSVVKERIVLLGPPASGKGTQAELIKERFHIEPTSPGAMLREELRAGSDLGKQADGFTSRGHLVPDPLVIALIGNWFKAHGSAFVFDGFPRTMIQARTLDALLKMRNAPLDIVFLFDVSFEVILDRVLHRISCEQCGRSYSIKLHFGNGEKTCPACGGQLVRRRDDTKEALEERMIEYREKSEPLVEFYRSSGLLHTLSAAERPEKVFSEISSVLNAA